VTTPDLYRLLRLSCWARLGLAELLLVLVPLMPAEAGEAWILAPALLVGVVASGVLLLLPAPVDARRAAWLVSLLDTVLVTAVVAATGGPRSIYSFLYVLSVVSASVLLPRPRAMAVAAVSSLLYTGLVWSRTVFPVFLLEPLQETTALEVLTIFLNAATFLVVAIVAGGLAERFRVSQRELETQRKDLRELQAFKDVILRSAGTGLVAVDRAHTLTALNQAAERLVGRPAAEAIGRPWADLFGDRVPLDAIERTIADHPLASARHETTLVRRHGADVPVRLTFSALHAADGSRLGLIGVLEDLTEMRDMERRVRQADRLATLGRMAANIAHEIRNPLASVTGAVEALASAQASGEERDRLLLIVARESGRLDRIITDFLEYARPGGGAPATTDVAQVIDDVLVLLEHRELPPGLEITRAFPASLPWRLDGHQFRQAVWNLCLNAVEAMPGGGELHVAASVDAGGLRIAVTDTGEGIAPSQLPHVLEPFYSTKPGGSGLGLALAHRAVQDHGGEIEVQSEPGLGTTVVITLPPAAEAAVVAGGVRG
jgi:two-component system sensor histidine kinase PilS (NtrC family)